jgi:hypothetical protein
MRCAGVLTMSVAYFIRRSGDVCAVIKLHPNNREEVVQSGLSLIEAEILCVALIEDIPRAPRAPAQSAREATAPESAEPKRRKPRQLALKF